MPEAVSLKLKSSIFDRERLLTIHPDYIEFDDTELKHVEPTRIEKKDITGYRIGTRFIRGYRFYIGRIYCIDIKGIDDKIIKLRLKSLYRVRKKKLFEKYSLIHQSLFNNYFNEVVASYLQLYKERKEFELATVLFTAEGVIFDKKVGLVTWFDLDTRAYTYYYALYSRQNPKKYKALEYMHVWNSYILYRVVEAILKKKE